MASADVTRFELSGTVTDQTGAVLPGVSVTLENADTGATRVAVTNERGYYTFPPVDPGRNFRLTVELSGFKKEVREGLAFSANTSPVANFQLEVGGLEETVTVTAESPVIETRISELKQSVDVESIETLPNNGRNFLQYVELSGSAVSTGGGSGNFSFNGQGRRMGNFVSDGVSMTGREIRTMNGEFGGGNGMSLDTIEEVQVISNGFKAEVGRTGAGTVSIVTKSGTNRFSGSAYTYQRPTSFVAKDPETGQERGLDRQQYGATLGGPIVRDRTHFFFNWESNRIDNEVIVTSVLDPGAFPQPQNNDQLFLKINHQINQNNFMDLRFNWNKNDQLNRGFGGLTTFERRSHGPGKTYNVVGSWVSTMGGDKFNELRARWTQDTVDFYSPLISDSGPESRTPDFSNAPGPAINWPGVGNSGPSPSLPQNLVEKRFQIVDHFSIQKGSHDLKMGGDVIYSDRVVTFFNNFVGTYSFRSGTPYPYNANNPATYPYRYTQNFGNSSLPFKDWLFGFFVQDDWEANPGLILNLGVRYDYDSLFQGDTNNFSPRLGFTWDLSGEGTTVVRGNFGLFYDTLESSLINRESNFGPEGQLSIDLRQGDPLFPQFPNRFDNPPPGIEGVPRATVYIPLFEGEKFPGSISDTLQRSTPYFVNWNLGIQRELQPGLALSADLVRVEGRNLLITFDANAPPYFALAPGQVRSQSEADALRPYGSPGVTPGPYGVDFGGFRKYYMQYNGGDTRYWGLKLGLEKRFTGRYGFQVRYTWSQARGDVDNFRTSGSFVPGLIDIDGDRSYQWGITQTDVPHFFIANGIYEFPYQIRFSGIFRTRSGFPYTGLAGYDADGDGFSSGASYGDRVATLPRNSFRMDNFVSIDLTLAKVFTFAERHGIELRMDIFNLFNTANTLNVNDTMGLDPSNPLPGFGDKVSWSDPRQFQLAIRYSF
jgi:outer membrane receptor protein involved in Fe transport